MPNRHAAVIIAGWAAIMLACLWLLRGTSVSHDLTLFMPTGATPQQRLAVELLRAGPASRLILIGLRGADFAELARVSRDMAQRARASDLFTQVANGDLDVDSDMQQVFRYRYLLDPATESNPLTAATLKKALAQRLDEQSRPLAILDRKTLSADPTAATRAVVGAWRPAHAPPMREGVWSSVDGHRALLVAVTRASGFDPNAQLAALAAIEQAFKSAQPAAGIKLEMSGAPVFANNARNTIRADMQLLSTAGTLMIVVLLLSIFRSPRLVLLGALPLATALVIGAAATTLLFGSVHGITLVFGMTLLGVAIDYPLHLFSHLHAGGGAAQVMRRLWPTVRLGAMTTCIGYLAIARRDFVGLAQLGVFTTFGLLAAVLVTRWLLPPLISAAPPPARWVDRLPRLLDLPRQWAGAVVVTAAAVTAGMFALNPPTWETELSALSPIPAAARRLDALLRGELGAADPNQLIVLTDSDVDRLLQRSEQAAERLEPAVTDGLLSGFDYAARYLPSSTTQQRRKQALPDPITSEHALAAALRGLPFKKGGFAPFLQDLEASRQLPPLAFDDIRGTPIAARVDPLLYRGDAEWTAMITLSGVTDPRALGVWWEAHGEDSALYLDLKQVSSSLLNEFRAAALERLLVGIGVIWLVMAIGLRSPRRSLRVLTPIVIAVLLTAVVVGVTDERLSMFHLIALLLVTGIGIDYSLFFHRREPTPQEHTANLLAVLTCAVSTLVVFGMLALSSIPVLRSIGLTVAVGVPMCFLLASATARLDASALRSERKQ